MVDSTGGYREKYRRAVEEQERLEKQFKFQLDALRKTLIQLGSAAQGLDKQLDTSLILMKEKFRGAPGKQVLEQLERVQEAAREFEDSRPARGIHAAKHISSMLDQLAELQLPSDLKGNLKSFDQGLKRRLESYRNYTEVLKELNGLHSLALESAVNPAASLWQRIRGGQTLKKEQDEAPEEKQEPIPEEETEFELVDEQDAELSPREGELIEAGESEYQDRDEDDADESFDPGDEDSYYKVAKRIARTLENLVTRIEPNDIVKHKIDIVRTRIKRGMDWYVLAVTLEDIRDILLLRYLQNDQEFSDYLKHVNEELSVISETLGLASAQNEKIQKASDNFSDTVSTQVQQMRQNMDSSNNIDELKGAVSDHLACIQSALADFKEVKQEDTASSLSEQLKTLINKIQVIESESEKTKELLEEERHRATHDVLTGLPNREAYNQRAYDELQRFKRYCRPLTLAVCDVDRFKSINDTYGHQVGDKVLKLIAQLISTRLRKVDFVARYGGEEFVMLMPETPTQQALSVLDKIRAVIAKTPFKFKGNPVKITISFGLALFETEDSVESVFERADQALYQAKSEGRNRCIIAPTKEENKE